MSSPDELRSYAVDCARLATAATDPRDKARLLSMARAWIDLAERIERLAQVPDSVAAAAVSPTPPQPEQPEHKD